MVFTMVSAVQDELTHIVESAEKHKAAEKEQLQKEAELAEQVHVANMIIIHVFFVMLDCVNMTNVCRNIVNT